MATTTRICRRFKTIGDFEYAADFDQAASAISVRLPDNNGDWFDDWRVMPFQVADCEHSRSDCERMIADYVMGRPEKFLRIGRV